MIRATLAASSGAALLAGCMAAETPPALGGASAGCPVSASRSWHAHLDAMPGPGSTGPNLIISGEVDLPTPGYSVTLEPGPADRMMPPSQRFRLTASPPGGMAAQVITPTAVNYRAKATYPAYRSIQILCGDQTLATITDIPTAH